MLHSRFQTRRSESTMKSSPNHSKQPARLSTSSCPHTHTHPVTRRRRPTAWRHVTRRRPAAQQPFLTLRHVRLRRHAAQRRHVTSVLLQAPHHLQHLRPPNPAAAMDRPSRAGRPAARGAGGPDRGGPGRCAWRRAISAGSAPRPAPRPPPHTTPARHHTRPAPHPPGTAPARHRPRRAPASGKTAHPPPARARQPPPRAHPPASLSCCPPASTPRTSPQTRKSPPP